MAPVCPLLGLSNDLLRMILDQIESDPTKLVHLDRRAYLSQESFAIPPPPLRQQAKDIGNLRKTCHRLADLGAIHQFARVSTRFSYRGFARLEWLAGQHHLAQHVRKLSYLLPNFYAEGEMTQSTEGIQFAALTFYSRTEPRQRYSTSLGREPWHA